jgi:hypothetical protein
MAWCALSPSSFRQCIAHDRGSSTIVGSSSSVSPAAPVVFFHSADTCSGMSLTAARSVTSQSPAHAQQVPRQQPGHGREADPLAARRPHLELYIRWMQEIRRFKPSKVSRRFSVTAGFYRTAVIDGLLEHSPAEHVRRPSVPAESPTLGFTHLQ